MNYYLSYFYINIMNQSKDKNLTATMLIGDFHFGTKTNSIQWLDTMLEYLNSQISYNILYYNVGKVVFLGDLFDVRYSTNTLVGVKVKDAIRNMVTKYGDVQFHILAGNHDYYSGKKEDMHYNVYEMVFGKEFLSCYDNLHIYTENPYLDEDGDLYMPWFFTEDEELYYQTMDHYKDDTVIRIFCHSDLMTWDKSKLLAKGKYTRVYSGHIHTPWKSEDGMLWNIGSALSLNFNDVNEWKHIYILEGNRVLKTIMNEVTPVFFRYYNEQIFDLDTFDNCFVQLYIDKDKVNKAEYIEKCKELKVNNPGIPIRVVTVDKELMDIQDNVIDLNQDIKKYIDSNIPEELQPKYNIIKNKLQEEK